MKSRPGLAALTHMFRSTFVVCTMASAICILAVVSVSESNAYRRVERTIVDDLTLRAQAENRRLALVTRNRSSVHCLEAEAFDGG